MDINMKQAAIWEINNDIMHMKGRQTWRNILRYSKNMTKDILSEYTKDQKWIRKLRDHLISLYLILKDSPSSL